MSDAGLAALGTVVLPEALGLRRDHVARAADRGPGYDAAYDFLTLAYDAVFVPEEGGVALVCPKLLNLERVLAAGALRLDGRAVRPRLRRFRRYDLAVLPSEARPLRLEIAFGGWRCETAVSAAEDAFAGRNVLLTVSRDNPLRWIADWARFHVRAHGADAALVFDNGSTAYGPAEIAGVLAEAGLGVVRVVPVDRPYGPIPLRGSRSKGMFLQQALLNLARRRFLAPARAVLQNDVDELVVSRSGRSVFDAAAAARSGFVKFRGIWRLPETPGAATALHRDHAGLPPGDPNCPAKYCIVPSGRMRGKSWNVHNLDALLLSRRFETDEFHYLHCRGISTRWKGERSRAAVAPAGVDAEARALLARML